jgi:hypothetical protein
MGTNHLLTNGILMDMSGILADTHKETRVSLCYPSMAGKNPN